MANIPDAEQQFADFFLEFRDRYLGSVLVARDASAPPTADSLSQEEISEQPIEPTTSSERTDQD